MNKVSRPAVWGPHFSGGRGIGGEAPLKMKTKPFGSTGVHVSAIGQGTWDLPESGSRLTAAKRALLRGVALGMTNIDTAEMYGDGRVEEILGDTFAGTPRETLFLASKVLPSNASFEGTLAACDASLRRLRTDYLDLFMLHWPSAHPLEGTMRGLETLVEQGKVRFIGVSNFDVNELREAQGYLQKVPLACNQVLYHLNERGVESRVVPYCREAGIAVVAYTPFGRGRFARDTIGMRTLETIARKHGASARQIVLAFLIRDPIVFAIPQAADERHVTDNAGGAQITLDEPDVAAIDAAYARGQDGPLASL